MKKNKDSTEPQSPSGTSILSEINLLDFYVYGYCYIGLMTGPFYTFKTFCDMLEQDGREVTTVLPALRNLKHVPFLAVPYLIIKAKYPLDYLESDECLQHPNGLLHILPVMFFTFNWYRWRYLIGWKLAESMCITAGVGAYPFECKSKPGIGPTVEAPKDFNPVDSAKQHNGDTHDFSTVHNIDVWEIEGCHSIRHGMKAWNKTVQWWMVHHIYKNLPVKSKNARLCLLLVISAYWHGIYSGYYLAFATALPHLIADSSINNKVLPYLTTDTQKYLWSWVLWFLFFRYMDFSSVPFMFLKFEIIWKIWSRVYFFAFVGALFITLLSFVIPRKHKKKE